MRHRDMRHAAFAEKRTLALMSAIDELVDKHKGSGGEFLLEGAASRQRNEIGHARAFEHVDIGAIVNVGGRQPVALVVARQKHDRHPRDLAGAQRRRRLAPGTLDLLLAYLFETRQVIDAGATNDAEYGLGHGYAWLP